MKKIVSDTSSESIMKTVHENWWDWLSLYGESSYMDIKDKDDYTISSMLDNGKPTISYCIRFQTSHEKCAQTIDEVLSFFKENEVAPLFFLTPYASPSNLGSQLEEWGLMRSEGNAAMATDLNKFSYDRSFPDKLEIKRIYNDIDTMKFWEIYQEGYPDNRMFAPYMRGGALHMGYDEDCVLKSYLGYYDGVPVATSQLVLTGGVAGLYSIVVLSEARGKGLGTAMTVDLMLKAKDLGYNISVLWATKMGKNIYRKLGFEEVFNPIMYTKTGEH